MAATSRARRPTAPPQPMLPFGATFENPGGGITMAYFVTGGTGFIGRFLVENLLKRGEPVYLLVRKDSQKKLAALRETWGADEKQLIAVQGDLGKPTLGIAEPELRRLKGKIQHMFHLAAVYDLNASAEEQEVANIAGTRHAVEVAAG